MKLLSTTILAGAMLASTTIPAFSFGCAPLTGPEQIEVRAALMKVVDVWCSNESN